MAGRPPKPTALKLLAGNPGKRPMNPSEPTPEAVSPLKIPAPPKVLDAEGKREWKRVALELAKSGLLTTIDRAALTGYCQSWSQWIEAVCTVRKEGAIVKTPNGFPVQSPWLAIQNKASDQMKKYLVEFGMTPASRSRIHVADPNANADPMDDFLGRKAARS
jgi:P27 family predicted phage terminase small subunit